MRIFLDECVDWRFARDLSGHEVRTARQMGWTAIRNGELLALASERFDIFLTVDRNLSFQQNIATVPIAVVVIKVKSNRLADLKSVVPQLQSVLPSAKQGSVTVIGS